MPDTALAAEALRLPALPRVLGRGALALALLLGVALPAAAQDPIEELRREVEALKRKNDALQTRVAELEDRDPAAEAALDLERRIGRILDEELQRRPLNVYPDPGGDELSLWEKVNRGLILTGFFRVRGEWRHRNSDFTGDGRDVGAGIRDALDDEGVRLNGRFRLGFGARIADLEHGRIESLTEFQTAGDLTNNSFFNLGAGAGVPQPVNIPLFQAPFEEVSLYRGYLDFDDFFGKDVRVRIGRQDLVFGNEFVLGNNQFFAGRTHDAIVISYEEEGTDRELGASLFYAKLAEFDNALNPASLSSDFDDDYLLGATFGMTPGEDLRVEAALLWFNARNTGVGQNDIFVTGSYPALAGATLAGTTGRFLTADLRVAYGTELGDGYLQSSAELVGQFGTSSHVNYDRIRGYGAEVVLNYWFKDPRPLYTDLTAREGLHPLIHLGYIFAQGSRGSTQGYQPLFPDRHLAAGNRYDHRRTHFPSGARAGTMDILPLDNLHLVRAAVSISPTPESELGMAWVGGWTDEGGLLPDAAGNPTSFYGHEIDLFGSYAPRFESDNDSELTDPYVPEVVFSANLSFFFPGEAATAFSSRALSAGTSGVNAGDRVAWMFFFQAQVSF